MTIYNVDISLTSSDYLILYVLIPSVFSLWTLLLVKVYSMYKEHVPENHQNLWLVFISMGALLYIVSLIYTSIVVTFVLMFIQR